MQRLKIIILLAGICGFGLVPQWYGQAAALDSDTQQACRQIDFYFTLDCPHCRRALAYLSDLEQRQPDLRIQRFEIKRDQEAFARFIEYHKQFGIEQPGVPFFLICDHYLTGFDRPGTTGRIIEEALGLSTQADTPAMSETGPIKFPLIGKVTVEEYGLPLFTIAIGLIDGFNPCAMWVLLFLLSLLVNLKSRARILLVAGTFVLMSGLVYYACMAAWLNLFLIIGFSRLLQIFVGLVAVLIGLIHVKDYFALKQGVSLSIPETAKPGLYQRMRD
ncbi:MAG: NrdH-redoxin, partial [Gammaproteobacteria bacterium]